MSVAKDKAISKNITQLSKVLELVPPERKAVAENLIKELAFIAKTLDELKATVDKSGAVDLFKQGKQEFMRESPALKAYNTTIQRYSLLYKQLCDLLPKPKDAPTFDPLTEFIQ